MNWLLVVGDRDILREATGASEVFWYRATRAIGRLIGVVSLTLVLLLTLALLILGPDGTGVPWLMREWLAVVFSMMSVAWVAYLGLAIFKWLPGRNDRIVLDLRRWIRSQVDPLEEQVKALTDEQLKAQTREFKQRLADGAPLDDVRPEAYACVREASRRAKNHRQYECQLIGGRVIEDCNVAEMRTGEGKTIVCYMANYLKILQGLRVHMVTVNDYLVKRDADFCRPIFELLGCTVGYISAEMETWGAGAEIRRQNYACDITYGTNSEFGFDYLRDNMKMTVRDQVQGRRDFAVVDEVDSILIDEARTPLIISGAAHDDVNNYRIADSVARSLLQKQEHSNREMRSRIEDVEKNPDGHGLDSTNPKYREGLKKFRVNPLWLSSDEAEAIGYKQYYVVEEDRKSAHMTEHGAKAAQQELSIGTFYDSKNMNWPHFIDNSLKAHLVYHLDKEYVNKDDQIVIVDEFTGRLMVGRQWSDGLHQAVEAKERVTIKQETQTLATITLQNFFKLYRQLAGMTGTAMTESEEFMKIYTLEVIAIPTNMPVRRIDYNDKIYKSSESKYDAIVEEIHSYAFDGYPGDPWSLKDMLRAADRTLRTVKASAEAGRKNGDPNLADLDISMIDSQIETAHGAALQWKDGKGDPQKLIDAYKSLMGDNIGGRPILVGTVSVENSEQLSQLLTRKYGVEHEVLNAKNHAREAEIVAKAGQQHEMVRGKRRQIVGNVTIATNMAGRGTDIKLGPRVAQIGGLHVVGTERHESRRIDNQLRGRCGRQGDPGSSRFFLSFDDELLRLFMGDWVLRMLNMLGFEEGMAIEDKRVNNGIARAQKKVEERNFNIRKNLLEYDEVMDYQRKTFYDLRQRVLEGREMSELIWEWIDQTVADAIERYYDSTYPAQCVSEWCSQNLGTPVDAAKLDSNDFKTLCNQVRDLASNDLRQNVQRTFGEYVDTAVDSEEWDVRGLAGWAAHYGLSLTQNQIKKAEPHELEEQIINAALQTIVSADLTPLQQYVDPLFAKARLVRWAKEKFEVDIPLDDISSAAREDAERIFRDHMRAAYRKREIEYPPAAVVDYALQRGGTNANEVYARVAQWVNRKYNLGWTFEHFTGKQPQEIFDELRALNEQYMLNGKLEIELDEAAKRLKGEELLVWAKNRFGAVLESTPLDVDGDVPTQLKRCGYEMLRYELTQLERYVLLMTLDTVWKDHMYNMDLLRHSIGLRGYAEQDPKIAYKREGTRMFSETLENCRERVTDLIFKVRIAGYGGGDYSGDAGVGAGLPPGAPSGGAYAGATASKADATNVGFTQGAADQQAAMAKQGEAGKPQTFRREQPRVGRNDPCPCGSGKKYKQCHGKNG